MFASCEFIQRFFKKNIFECRENVNTNDNKNIIKNINVKLNLLYPGRVFLSVNFNCRDVSAEY